MAAPKKVEFILTARDLTRRAFSRIGRSIRRIRGLGAAIAGGAIAAAARHMGQFAQNTVNAARALSLTTTELQALRAFGQEFGIQADDIDDAIHSINTAMAETNQGSAEMAQSMRRLGVGRETLARGPLHALAAISAATQLAGDDVASLSADLNRVFGEDVTRRILPLLRQGPEGLIGGMMRAVEGGAVTAAGQLQAANQAYIEAQRLATIAVAQSTQKTVEAAQAVGNLADELDSAVERIRGRVDSLTAVFTDPD